MLRIRNRTKTSTLRLDIRATGFVLVIRDVLVGLRDDHPYTTHTSCPHGGSFGGPLTSSIDPPLL